MDCESVTWLQTVINLVIAIIGGTLAAIISLSVDGRRRTQDRNRAASHLATRLIDVFERYAVSCANAIQTNNNNYHESPYDFQGIASLPTLDALPEDDIGWRAIDPTLSIEAQTFGNRITGSEQFIRGVVEYGDSEDVESEVNKHATLLGASAWNFAASLRNRYAFPAGDAHYDIADVFCKEEANLARIEAARKESQAKLWDEVSTAEPAVPEG